jgi:hypothetical protein
MTKTIVATDAEQLLVGVIRGRTMIAIRGGVDITLVHDSPFVHTSPCDGVYSHANSNPFGRGSSSPTSNGDSKRDVVGSTVAYEAVRSGG